MEHVDTDNWRDVDAGVRPVAWSDIIGDPDSATFLTTAGRDLSRRMVEDLTAFVGQTWLPSVLSERDKPYRVSDVFRSAPTLALSPDAAVDSFLTVVRWWASIAVHGNSPGLSVLRRDLRANLTEQRFLHTVTMLRLGAIARSAGLEPEFEPTPGDLLVTAPEGNSSPADAPGSSPGISGRAHAGQSVTIEVAVMGTPRAVADFERRTDELFDHLRSLEHTHHVHFYGQLPQLDSDGGGDTDVNDWRTRTADAAANVERLGTSLAIETAGRTLHVTPGPATNRARLEGPLLEVDAGTRIQRTVRAKSQQVNAASNAWLWIENRGAVDALNTFNQLTPPQQVKALRDLTESALAAYPHMRGLTFSTETRHFAPPRTRHRITIDTSTLLSVPVWPRRIRTSITVPNGPCTALDMMEQLLSAEEGWLDWALRQILGLRAVDLVATTSV